MSSEQRRRGAQNIGSSPPETNVEQEPGYEGQTYPGRPSVEEEYRKAGTEDVAGALPEQAQEYAAEARDVAAEYAEKTREQVEAGREQAAAGMQRAASELRQRASQTGGMPAEAGSRMADTMEQTAAYLREHSTSEIWDDVETYVRRHPAQALAGAAFAGFMLGRVLR